MFLIPLGNQDGDGRFLIGYDRIVAETESAYEVPRMVPATEGLWIVA